MTEHSQFTAASARDQAAGHEAFEQIVKDYTGFVYRTALSVVRDPAEADEVVQSTFVKVYRKLDTFEGRSALRTWLYRVTINQAKNRLRDRSRHLGQQPEELNMGKVDDPSIAIEREQRRRALHAALDKLPEVQGQVARLRLAEELSFAEIGRMLKISENAAKVNFHHAVKRLKEILTP